MSATVDEALAGQQTNEGPAPDSPPAELSDIEKHDKLDEELKLSTSEQNELLGLEPEPEIPPPDDEPPDRDEPGEGEGEGDEAEAPAEQPAADDKEPWTYARFRRAKKEIGSQREQLAGWQQQLQQQAAEVQRHQQQAQELRDLAAKDPAAAFRAFAELTGARPDDLYQQVTEHRLMRGTEAEQEKAVSPEMRALQQRLDAFEAQQKKEQEALQQQQLEAVRLQEARSVYQVAVHGAEDGDGNRKEYPYLAALPPAELESIVRSAVDMAAELRAERGTVFTIERVCSVLDQQAQKNYEHQYSRHQKRLEASSKAGASGANGASQESSPDEGNPAGDTKGRRSERKPRQPRAPGNRAGAGTSPGARPKTRDEIDDELERGLMQGLSEYRRSLEDLGT